eukprot:328072_1
MEYLAFNHIDYKRKCKNKWKSQQIQKKFKNKHYNDEYDDMDKKHCKKVNRIKHQQSSKIIDFKLRRKSRKKQQTPAINYYKISVNISLLKNTNKDDIIDLKHSQYRIIPSQLQNAVLQVYDKTKRIFYLTYSFIPCSEFYSSASDDTIYQKQSVTSIPLLLDENNALTNINKPLFNIAQTCLDARNASDGIECYNIMPYDWNVSNVEYLAHTISVTVTTTVMITNEPDANKFIKSRPFSKKEMNAFSIFDAVDRKRLKCGLVTQNGHNTYVNVPLLMRIDMASILKSLNLTQLQAQKKEKPKKKETQKYWFCGECFMMNLSAQSKEEKKSIECTQCNHDTAICDMKWYYDAYVAQDRNTCDDEQIPLSWNESKALNYINTYSQKESAKSSAPLLHKIKRQGNANARNGKEIYDKLLQFMAEQVPLIIHLKAANLIPLLLKDTRYKNLFEVGTGGGCTNKDTRSRYENVMFPNIYQKGVSSKEKPKYGCLNVGLKPDGCSKARSYGTSFFTLRNETVRWRVSYTNQDSFCANGNLATLRDCKHLLHALSDDELKELCDTAIQGKKGGCRQGKYREIQIHGPLLLKRDIQSLHVPKREQFNSKIYQEFAHQNSCELIWF